MQAQLVCILVLFLTYGGICTDVDQEHQALEEDLLNSLLTSEQLKQIKQSALYWRQSVANLCRMVNRLREPWNEAWQSGEEDEGEGPREGRGQKREKVFNLSHICRMLQNHDEQLLHDSLEYLDGGQYSSFKRKSPYILKRQAAPSTKSRRPYILKRSTIY